MLLEMHDDFFIEDWAATCAIYNIEYQNDDRCSRHKESSVAVNDTGTVFSRWWTCHSLLVPSSAGGSGDDDGDEAKIEVSFVQKLRSPGETVDGLKKKRRVDPKFVVRTCQTTAKSAVSPVFQVEFRYVLPHAIAAKDDNHDDATEATLESATVRLVSYPSKLWPQGQEIQKAWIDWMQSKVDEIIVREPLSYSVCEFMEHGALDFFGPVFHPHNKDTLSSTNTVIVCLRYDVEGTEESIAASAAASRARRCSVPVPLRLETTTRDCADVVVEERVFGVRPHWVNRSAAPPSEPPPAPSTKTDPDSLSTTTKNMAGSVEDIIMEGWRDWTELECPICLCTYLASELVETVPCRHFFCRDCLGHFMSSIVADLQYKEGDKTENPFACPLPRCRQRLDFKTCVKGLLSGPDELAKIRGWIRDRKEPPSFLLTSCPATQKCGARGSMRREGPSSHFVFCQVCHIRWCELCMRRCSSFNTSEDDHGIVCDQAPVLALCDQYRLATTSPRREENQTAPEATEEGDSQEQAGEAATGQKKEGPQEGDDEEEEEESPVRKEMRRRWPWIPQYSAARSTAGDDLAFAWVKKFATRCPGCNTGIERSEGCFHMECSRCNTHFCYECGDELFPPYYGTHHCWLKEAADAFAEDDAEEEAGEFVFAGIF